MIILAIQLVGLKEVCLARLPEGAVRKAKRSRLQLDFSPQEWVQLGELKKHYGVPNYSEAVRRAIQDALERKRDRDQLDKAWGIIAELSKKIPNVG
jgi:hypothetical protein